MGRKVDLTGQRFGRLTVIEECGRKNGSVLWKCRCDCGSITTVRSNHLRRGLVVSCGCYNTEVINKHGRARTELYHVWQCMKDRCQNESNVQFKDYGGRGIKICNEWQDSEAFCRWALENGYRKGLSIDRIDVDGNYEPSNCRWATQKQQCRNRRNNAVLEYLGEKHCLAEWAELLNEPYSKLYSRFRRGWSTQEILFGKA